MLKLDPDKRDERVLILAPTGRDASLTGKYLAEAGITVETCNSMEQLCAKLLKRAGAALISEEALTSDAVQRLIESLYQQPAWSDLPVVILTSGEGATPANISTLKALGEAGNMTLIERPTRVITLVSAIRSALRARRRQYQVRAHLAEEQRAQEERSKLLEEAVEAREESEAANRAKDIFLATLSHELRTPLTAVLGWARMLRSVKMDDDTARHGLLVIERNAVSQNQLIQDLLDVSRIISGKLRLEVRPVRLIQVIEAAVDSMRQAAEAKGIPLDIEFQTGSDLVMGDPDRLQQVVWNLLSNAIRFTPKAGHVSVRLEHQSSDVIIKVIDTGQGIASEFLPYVFERFRQADGSTTREHGGLGLGLAVVRHLVEQHGGKVSVESEGKQHGSTFMVSLPLAAIDAHREAKQGEEASARTDTELSDEPVLGGLRVLVVDDQADARELLTMVLKYAGAEVITAGSTLEALALIRQPMPDVIVSDIGMPGEDGYSLIQQLRALSSAAGIRIPAVALTAYAAEEDRQRALSAGFVEHLSKPVEPSHLVAVVAQAAGRTAGSSLKTATLLE